VVVMGCEGLKDVRKDFSDRTRRKKVLSHILLYLSGRGLCSSSLSTKKHAQECFNEG